MQKYLVIIILIVLTYYLFNCWFENKINNILKTKEGFAATGGDADVASSINTLSQIANDLQTGKGLKVPGVLNILGALNTDGDINAKGGINSDGLITGKDSMKLTQNIYLGDGKQKWGSVINLRGGIAEDGNYGYIDFKNKDDIRQCILQGIQNGAKFTNNLIVDGTLTVGTTDILKELKELKNALAKNKVCREVTTKWDDDSIKRGIEYLDRHEPACNINESIKAIKMERSGNNLRYNYTCCG